MLGVIWETIGIIIGVLILAPLLMFVVAIFAGCFKELFNLIVATANATQAWIDKKINK